MNTTDPSAPTRNETAWALVFGAWLVASASALGALFLSEVMHIAPCVLCWYQRICMFPLVLILAFGMFPLDPKVSRYALPLAVTGLVIAVFHLLLMAGVIPESIQPCTRGIPCSEKTIEWFGFVTVPMLSAVAFTTIIALLTVAHFRSSK